MALLDLRIFYHKSYVHKFTHSFINSLIQYGRASSLDVVTLRYANVASNALLVFNSAVNIVVYCLADTQRDRSRASITESLRDGWILLHKRTSLLGTACCSKWHTLCRVGTLGPFHTGKSLSKATFERPKSRDCLCMHFARGPLPKSKFITFESVLFTLESFKCDFEATFERKLAVRNRP